MGRLEGKVAVVTGSSSGIGRAVARLFAKEGAKVGVVDINAVGGEETVQQVRIEGGEASFFQADVTKSEEVRRMGKQVHEKFGTVTILHNNAGGWKWDLHDTVTDNSEEEWDRLIDLNLKSVFLVSKEFLPGMMKKGGSIINTVSINSFMPVEQSAAYSAGKAGGYTLTKAMALDYAKYGVRVNGIAPGEILTPLQIKTMDAFPDPKAGMEAISRSIPLGRFGEPEDIATVALFLASDDARYVTGEIIVADGGLTIGRAPYPEPSK
jgi:meso-butanediol dehydrogenase/(S,S)-butanediol dehydrogenase/diacetyl reductase